MIRGQGLILAMTVAFAAACASSGGGGETAAPETGNAPRDNSYTNSAGVHLVQAGLTEGEEAFGLYEAALEDAMEGIQEDSTNPKLYMQAGQASIGLEDWSGADTLLAQALDLYPGYEENIIAEREEAWVTAYNTGADQLNAEDTQEALRYFEGAATIYDGRPEAHMALGSVYLQVGNTEAAAEAYRDAVQILNGPPPEGMDEEQLAGWAEDRQVAAFNAAQLLAQSGRFDEAATILENFLSENQDQLDPDTELRANTALAGFLAQAGREEEAEQLYNEIFARGDLTSADYFQVGIGFFNTEDYARAAEAFTAAAELNPYSRDALLNLVQSLYSQAVDLEEEEATPERDAELIGLYDNLLDAAEQVRGLDPLNRNLLSFMLRSLRAKADLVDAEEAEALAQETQELYRRYQEQPYGIEDIGVSITEDDRARVTGLLTNLTGTPGDEVQIRFALVDEQGNVVESDVMTVTAPEQNSAVEFSTTLDAASGTFAGWMYEILD
ncbi:MAG: tetratricopeptide repeat protein [Longimicrobiales bacterium]